MIGITSLPSALRCFCTALGLNLQLLLSPPPCAVSVLHWGLTFKTGQDIFSLSLSVERFCVWNHSASLGFIRTSAFLWLTASSASAARFTHYAFLFGVFWFFLYYLPVIDVRVLENSIAAIWDWCKSILIFERRLRFAHKSVAFFDFLRFCIMPRARPSIF